MKAFASIIITFIFVTGLVVITMTGSDYLRYEIYQAGVLDQYYVFDKSSKRFYLLKPDGVHQLGWHMIEEDR